MTRVLATAALVVLAASTSVARAQEAATEPRACEEGRVRISDRCCWPGQSWSEEHRECIGPPSCPAPLVEHGEHCIAREADFEIDGEPETDEAPPAPAAPVGRAVTPYPAVPPGYGGEPRWSPGSTEAWPSVRSHGAAPTRRAISARGEDEGLVFTSIAIIQAGWMMGLVGTVMTEATGCSVFGPGGSMSRSCDAWAWGFLPLAGGMIGGVVGINRGNGWGYALGIPSVIHQGIGLIMLAVALANETTEIVEQPLEGATGLSARLVPSAAGADAGLSLDVTF